MKHHVWKYPCIKKIYRPVEIYLICVKDTPLKTRVPFFSLARRIFLNQTRPSSVYHIITEIPRARMKSPEVTFLLG
jgi:hypothetical protein